MALQNITETIDGDTYFASQLAPLKAVKLMAKVLKTLGPAAKALGASSGISLADLKNMAKDMGGEDAEGEKTKEALGLIASMCAEINENDVESLIESALTSGSVRKNGQVIDNLDVHFDNPMTMLKVVVMVLKVNFKNFFQRSGI